MLGGMLRFMTVYAIAVGPISRPSILLNSQIYPIDNTACEKGEYTGKEALWCFSVNLRTVYTIDTTAASISRPPYLVLRILGESSVVQYSSINSALRLCHIISWSMLYPY